MNSYALQPERYRERWLTPLLQQASRDHPVVVLTGARQVGKSTLLRHAEPFCHWRFQTLDDLDLLEQAHAHPEALWAGSDRIILDEVQKAPKLLSAVKYAIDREPGRYRFILSGSANLLLMQQVSESLAGRAVYFILDPMTLGEIEQRRQPVLLEQLLAGEFPLEEACECPSIDLASLLLRGAMPPLLRLDEPSSWSRWWEGYVTTYLERDLRQIAQIDSLLDFRRLMQFVALRSGQLLNQSELGRDARLSQSTVHRYLNLLETTHLFERLPAYAASHTTSLLRAPKPFIHDTGLAIFLSGYFDLESLRRAREWSSFFETLIYHHLRVLTRLLSPQGHLYFWRTRGGQEVDFVVEHGRKVIAIEAKSSPSPSHADAKGLRSFLQQHPEAVAGVLLHGGTAIKRLDEKIIALPWPLLAGL